MTFRFTAALFITLVLASCASSSRQPPQTASSPGINWPQEYEPSRSRFYIHNEIDIQASSEKVWRVLTDCMAWSSYYDGARQVRLEKDSQTRLMPDSVILWKTMGLSFRSSIREYEPQRRLSWESMNSKIRGYHAWLIIPQKKGCKLVTEESQLGWLTFFEKTFQPNKLHRLHDEWLRGIQSLAEALP